MSKEKHQPLSNAPRYLRIEGDNNKAIIHFKNEGSNNPSSEFQVLEFVINSYKTSCITLLNELKRYTQLENVKDKITMLQYYLPAMFCFRHYIELKLKYLYMYYNHETFNSSSHNLQVLLDQLKKKNESPYKIFDDAIEFLKQYEKFVPNGNNFDSYFRYLFDKQFNREEKLTIPIAEISKIENYILEIEFRILCIQNNEFIRKIKHSD